MTAAVLTWEAALAIRRVGVAHQVLLEGDRVGDAGLIDVKHASLPRALPGDGDEAVEGCGAEGLVEHLPAARADVGAVRTVAVVLHEAHKVILLPMQSSSELCE